MSPEFYAIIGVGIGLASLIGGIGGVILYFIIQTNKRIDDANQRLDRLQTRMDRLEEKFDRLAERFDELLERIHAWKESTPWICVSLNWSGCWTPRCTASR